MIAAALPIEESLRSMKSSGKKNSHSLQKMSMDSSKSKKSQPNLSANSLLIKSNPNLSLTLSTTKPHLSNSNSHSNISVHNASQTSQNPNLSPKILEKKSSHASIVLGQGSIPIVSSSVVSMNQKVNEGNLTSSVYSVGEKSLTQKSLLSPTELAGPLPAIHPQASSSSGNLTLTTPAAVTDGQQRSELPPLNQPLLDSDSGNLPPQPMKDTMTVSDPNLTSSVVSSHSQLLLPAQLSEVEVQVE
eukprot:gene32058-42777_t